MSRPTSSRRRRPHSAASAPPGTQGSSFLSPRLSTDASWAGRGAGDEVEEGAVAYSSAEERGRLQASAAAALQAELGRLEKARKALRCSRA